NSSSSQRSRLFLRCPQDASGSAQSLVPFGGGREKVSMSVQSTARAALAVLCSSGMLASSRSSQAACSSADGSPSGFGLPVRQQVRAVLPLGDHAEPPLLFPGQAGQRLVDAGEVGGPPVGLGQAH